MEIEEQASSQRSVFTGRARRISLSGTPTSPESGPISPEPRLEPSTARICHEVPAVVSHTNEEPFAANAVMSPVGVTE